MPQLAPPCRPPEAVEGFNTDARAQRRVMAPSPSMRPTISQPKPKDSETTQSSNEDSLPMPDPTIMPELREHFSRLKLSFAARDPLELRFWAAIGGDGLGQLIRWIDLASEISHARNISAVL